MNSMVAAQMRDGAGLGSVDEPGKPAIIRTPADAVALLTAVCPGSAEAFARAEHERACWSYDEHRIAFWREVAVLLAAQGQADDRAAWRGARA